MIFRISRQKFISNFWVGLDRLNGAWTPNRLDFDILGSVGCYQKSKLVYNFY